MARDFRPKDKKAAPGGSRSSVAGTPNAKKTASPAKQALAKKPSSAGFDSEDSVDEEVLLREITAMGGSKEDLDLVKVPKGKSKTAQDLDDFEISNEVASFLKQLKANPAAPEPKKQGSTSTPKQAEARSSKDAASKKAEKKEKKPEQPTAKPEAKKADRQTKDKAPVAEVKPEERKGKRQVFDQDGNATVASTSFQTRRPDSLRLDPAPAWTKSSLPAFPSYDAKAEMLPTQRVEELHQMATQLLEQENQAYEDITSSETALSNAGGSVGTLSASDARFVRSLLSSTGGGTLGDRISALTLLVQSSPVHNMKAMDSLLNMARKKSREEAGKATRALADWLASAGGLGERKLFYFRDQPQLAAASKALATVDAAAQHAARSHLLIWAFEDHLKKYYFNFLQVLEVQAQDPIAFVRKQAVTQTFILLKDKPEQEQNLLRLLVNKLGDSERAVASKVSNHLLELLAVHPTMKFIVVREVANLILRPAHANADKDAQKQNPHARYYGLLTLNQTILTSGDTATANHLILLYFNLFEGLLAEREAEKGGREEEEVELDENGKPIEKKADKGRWRDNKGGKGKGKGKNKSEVAEPKTVADADAKMTAAILAGVRRAFPFAKVESDVFEKHIATLFRITHSGTFNICIQALQLVFQLTISNPNPDSTAALNTTAITDRFYRVLYDSLLDPRLETSSKQAMYLNLLFQALKADQEESRKKAFIKRICQILSLHQPPFICGCLFLLGELFKRQPSLKVMLTDPEEADEDEHFEDVASSDEEGGEKAKPQQQVGKRAYAGRKRDPRFSNAEITCLWDVVPLLHHFHPTVALHASQLLQSEKITSSADLSLNTLSHFLDRFVYRNPKTKSSSRGVSIMQPTPSAGRNDASVLRSKAHDFAEESYVNDAKFWKKKVEDVPADQLFFHQFFNLKSQKDGGEARKDEDEDASEPESDDEEADEPANVDLEELDEGSSEEEDPNEKAIWEAMKKTMPGNDELQGLDDSEDDFDEEEFDYVDSEDENQDLGGEEEEEAEKEEDSDDGPQVLEGMDFSDEDEEEDDISEAGDVFDEDDDDLVPFADFDGDSDDEEAPVAKGKKRGADTEQADSKKSNNKKRKTLPTFASADDYAHMLDSGDEGDV